MIPKSGYRFSEEIMPAAERDPEKWKRFSEKITRTQEAQGGMNHPAKTMNEEVLS